jgi:hypothetical protein
VHFMLLRLVPMMIGESAFYEPYDLYSYVLALFCMFFAMKSALKTH